MSKNIKKTEIDFNSIKAEFLEEIKLRFSVRYGTYTDKDMTPIAEVFRILDQIGKDIEDE